LKRIHTCIRFMVELKFVQCWPPSKGSIFDANLRYTRCVRHMAVGGPVFGTDVPNGPKYTEMSDNTRRKAHMMLLLELHHGVL
jgi:hypothetical protein